MLKFDLIQLLQIGTFVVTAVWAVSKIKGTTERLGLSMEHLSRAVEKLDYRLEKYGAGLGDVKDRVTRIEARLDGVISAAVVSPGGEGQ